MNLRSLKEALDDAEIQFGPQILDYNVEFTSKVESIGEFTARADDPITGSMIDHSNKEFLLCGTEVTVDKLVDQLIEGRESVPFDQIRVGDRVTIAARHAGQRLRGRAVMKGPHGWVLNLGGPHGTPGIATSENFIAAFHPREKKGPEDHANTALEPER